MNHQKDYNWEGGFAHARCNHETVMWFIFFTRQNGSVILSTLSYFTKKRFDEKMSRKGALLGLLLCATCCWSLPVNRNGAQVKEKHGDQAEVPSLDPSEYLRYIEELTKSDPGKSIPPWGTPCVTAVRTEFLERMNKVKGMDMAKLHDLIVNHPHIRERLLNSGNPSLHNRVRNQMEEAKRMTVEQMRQLQK